MNVENEAQPTTWEEVIVDFLEMKRDKEEENYLKDEIKIVGDLYDRLDYFDDDNIRLIFDTRKNKKDKDESALDFQQRRARSILKLDMEKIPEQLNVFQK